MKTSPPTPRKPRAAPAAPRPRSAPRRGASIPKLGAGLPLPHEHDESVASTAATPDPVIVQAKRDLDAGLVDTDMRATPGLDAERRAQLVPGPGGKKPR